MRFRDFQTSIKLAYGILHQRARALNMRK